MRPTQWPPPPTPTPDESTAVAIANIEAIVETLALQQLEGDTP